MLDACFNKDRSPYCRGNFDWTQAFIPDEELVWLDEELKAATTPVVVFCHQLLDGFSAGKGLGGVFVGNWKQAVGIMERHGNVIASIQGHHHRGHYSFRNGIHYWTMKAMISGVHPPHNSYAVVEVSPDGNIASTAPTASARGVTMPTPSPRRRSAPSGRSAALSTANTCCTSRCRWAASGAGRCRFPDAASLSIGR